MDERYPTPANTDDLRDLLEAVETRVERDGDRTRYCLGIIVLMLAVVLYRLFS